MKTNKDPKGLITQDSIMVAPRELNDDANWTLVESKQTRKLREKERLENLAQFPPLPTVNEGSVAMSTETASSKRRANKINLKKIFNEDKQSSGTPRTITIKNIDLIKKEEKCTKSEEKKVIDISSSTDTFDDLTSISESTTEDSSGIFTIETRSSSDEDSSTPSIYKRKNLNEKIREQAYSAKCATDSNKKIKKVEDMKTPSKEPEENQDFLKEQEKLYQSNSS